MRKVKFLNGKYYHIFNRGVDKRDIFSNKFDVFRFIQSMDVFNNVDTGNDIFYKNRSKKLNVGYRVPHKNKLVNVICYCLNSNHYHFILEQLVDNGISDFMKRLGGGYSVYFNEKYKRSGALFQGRFKAVHIESDSQLLHDSVYVNLNNKVHKKFGESKKHFLDLIPNRSSWGEYIGDNDWEICKKSFVLDGNFKDFKEYKKFAEKTLEIIREKRYEN